MTTGFWVSRTSYRVMDDSGRTEDIGIWGTREEYEDHAYMAEMEHMARETVEDGWKKEATADKKPYSEDRGARRELGGVLSQIRVSRAFQRKHREHGKWW